MFLQKQTQGFDTPKFYYDGARLLDGMTIYYFNKLNGGFQGVGDKQFGSFKYLIDDKIKDLENIKLLKEELGTDFIERQMYKQFTRNNAGNEKDIKNNFQRNLYQDLQKQNNFLASMFLYFFHKFYYDVENNKDTNDLDKYRECDAALPIYKNIQSNGLPTSKIIEEVKTVYPYMHNLFVKLLEIKYGYQANIALMNIQDAKESLKEAELTGQIAKIKIKKPTKLELAKK